MELIILQIDLARQKENIEYIKSYVDFAKENGYNAILYYLENAVRTPDTEFFNPEETYSLAEMREIVEYTEEKGLDAIPAIENLGHLEKFLAYPELSHLAECKVGAMSRFYGEGAGSAGCCSNPEFYAFMDKYTMDVLSVFNSKYVHVGLDEVFDFAICPRCKARLLAGETKADMFLKHILHTYELVTRTGHEMMMWDDFFECMDVVERLPRDIIFTTWNYTYVQDEPQGHWTNRVKRDSFAYYGELGFRYLFCTAAHKSSSTFNTDSFNRYADKYRPFGAIMTAWERAQDLYLGAYPQIAAAGRRWSDKIAFPEEQLEVYTELLESEECASLLLSLSTPMFISGAGNVAAVAENDSISRRTLRHQLYYATEKLYKFYTGATGRAQDIMGDAYCHLYTTYAELELTRIGDLIFDIYQTDNLISTVDIESYLMRLEVGYLRCQAIMLKLWLKYRSGIKSCADAFSRKYKDFFERIDRISTEMKDYAIKGAGILYADLMLHDGFCTVRGEIKIKYESAESEELLYTGPIKSYLVDLEAGGTYTVKFRTENRKIEYITFSAYGEGAIYPVNFRYISEGKKWVASDVYAVSGEVCDEKNILKGDTSFATLGYNDGIAHFNDLSLGRKRSTVRVGFKPLI